MRLTYLTHPEVVVDPAVPVPLWSLSAAGRARLVALLGRGWPARRPALLIHSPERKAAEAAALIGAALQLAPRKDALSGEVDRSATGYVPHDRHEALADALFARPGESAAGWETAQAAQARILAAFRRGGTAAGKGDLLMVGHGAVGTLLLCALTGRAIARREDQPRQGCVFSLDLGAGHRENRLLHGWLPFEQLNVT